MNQRKKRRVIGCGIGAAILILFAVLSLRHTDPRLLERSTKAFTLDAMSIYIHYPSYYWLSPHEALVLEARQTSAAASRVDVATGETRPIPGLASAITNTFFYNMPVASADHKWLLQQRIDNDTQTISALDLSGRPYRPWSIRPTVDVPIEPIWLNDSSHWLEFYKVAGQGDVHLVRHGLNDADKELGAVEKFNSVLGEDRDGHLLVYRAEAISDTSHRLDAYDIATGASVGVKLLPLDGRRPVSGVKLSPSKDRVAFIQYVGGDYVFPEWFGRHFGGLAKVRSAQSSAIWICGVNGRGLHELGAITDKEDHGYIYDLQWLPDGKSISFTLNKQVWITAAD